MGLIAFFCMVRLTLSVEKPNPAQQIAEMVNEFTGSQAEQVIGHGYERFQAFVTCILLFVVLNNLLGLIPAIVTPTSQPWVPLGIAVLTFVYYHFQGPRAGLHRLYEAICGADVGDCVAIVSHRDHLPLRAHDVAHHSSLRQLFASDLVTLSSFH